MRYNMAFAERCQSPDCEKEREAVVIWQSDTMAAPAFWYECLDHARESLKRLDRKGCSAALVTPPIGPKRVRESAPKAPRDPQHPKES